MILRLDPHGFGLFPAMHCKDFDDNDNNDDYTVIKNKDDSGLEDVDNHRRRQWQAQRCLQSS